MFKHTIFSIKSLSVGWTQALDLAMMKRVPQSKNTNDSTTLLIMTIIIILHKGYNTDNEITMTEFAYK